MKYVSLFAGVGGFDLALNRLGHECVYANDFDKYAKLTYDKNFLHNRHEAGREAEVLQGRKPDPNINASQRAYQGYTNGGLDTTPIQEVPTSAIPDHDLLVGGFPCQAFSIAGKRLGFNDTRGTLFFDIARILRAKKPRYFILENVKGLLSHDNGNTFKTIIATLVELGYDLQWQVLNSKNFGVPQNRERVFIVGHIRGEPRPKVFPIGAGDENNTQQTQELRKQISNTLRTNYSNGKSNETYVGEIMTFGKFGQKGVNETLKKNPLIKGEPKALDVYNKKAQDVSPTLTEPHHNSIRVFDGMRIRRLTPLECLRLQGFPDDWFDVPGLSDTQKYKQAGNAVTVNVVYEVAKRLRPNPTKRRRVND